MNVFYSYEGNNKKIILTNSEIEYYEFLFNTIDFDYYNLSKIYTNLSMVINKIKIKHKSKNFLFKKEACVLGVLCNDKGLHIEKNMLNWLLPEYDVYCVYQKYPGTLFEFPALRFAQWLSMVVNKQIILYLHTKGAFNYRIIQDQIRELWKYEFTQNRKKIYIKLLKNNYTDISTPFRWGSATWFNGMFISKRAFNLIV